MVVVTRGTSTYCGHFEAAWYRVPPFQHSTPCANNTAWRHASGNCVFVSYSAVWAFRGSSSQLGYPMQRQDHQPMFAICHSGGVAVCANPIGPRHTSRGNQCPVLSDLAFVWSPRGYATRTTNTPHSDSPPSAHIDQTAMDTMASAVMTGELHKTQKMVATRGDTAVAETRGFCPDPVLFPALRPTPSEKTQERLFCADPASTTMGACYPKCMGVRDDQLLPGAHAKRSAAASAMDATPYETELLNKMQTFDLEELGLAAASQATHKKQEGIVVDYEDSDGEHPELQDQSATCAPSACATVLTNETNGRRTRRRSRCSSSEGSLRGKSVIFEQDMKTAEPVTPNTSDTDAEEDMRCSKVHKLCMCEVKLHRSLESCWLVCSDQVYDVTGLVTAHPGGVRSILRKAGGPDCARDMKFHTKKARKMMEKCFIGKLQQCGDDVDCSGDANCSIM